MRAQPPQPELLLDRPVRRRWTLPEQTREGLLFIVLLAVTVVVGWHSYRHGDLKQIEAQVAELVIQARQAELARIVGSEEALRLQDADRAEGAVVRAIERAP